MSRPTLSVDVRDVWIVRVVDGRVMETLGLLLQGGQQPKSAAAAAAAAAAAGAAVVEYYSCSRTPAISCLVGLRRKTAKKNQVALDSLTTSAAGGKGERHRGVLVFPPSAGAIGL